jgi:hypothetical protein
LAVCRDAALFHLSQVSERELLKRFILLDLLRVWVRLQYLRDLEPCDLALVFRCALVLSQAQ